MIFRNINAFKNEMSLQMIDYKVDFYDIVLHIAIFYLDPNLKVRFSN